MSSVRSQRLHPAFLAHQLHGQPITPQQAEQENLNEISLLSALKAKSGQSSAVLPQALSVETLDNEHDQQRQTDQACKRLLAHSKLVAQILGAALRHSGSGSEAVPSYLFRAADWVTAHERLLSERWEGQGNPLSNYHQFELRRFLVTLLQETPALMEAALPPVITDLLTAPTTPLIAWLPEGDQPSWPSAGDERDISLAYGRAISRVMVVCQRHDFNRDPATLLADAKARIETVAKARAKHLMDTLPLQQSPVPVDETTTWKIIMMHAINTTGQTYAACLERVYRESVAMIERYQHAIDQDDDDHAEQIAQNYQAQKLGYEGVAHHFTQLMTLMDDVALLQPRNGATPERTQPTPFVTTSSKAIPTALFTTPSSLPT